MISRNIGGTGGRGGRGGTGKTVGKKRKCDFINADELPAKNHAKGNAGH